MKLGYVIKYVADMDNAVAYFRDKIGLELRFQSPDWSEFATGETTLALHAASESHPAGSTSIGFNTDDLDKFYDEARAAGVEFTAEPTETFGRRIARFKDSEGSECGVSGM
jgi:predicted enzyme related to lactoylglutathione lyase